MIPHLSMLSFRSEIASTSLRGMLMRSSLCVEAVKVKFKTIPSTLQVASFKTMRLENRSSELLVSRKFSTVNLETMSLNKKSLNIEIQLLNIMRELAERSKKSLDGYMNDLRFLTKGCGIHLTFSPHSKGQIK